MEQHAASLKWRRAENLKLLIARFLQVIVVIVIWFHAGKARRNRRAASLVFRNLRERTERTLEGDALRRRVIHIFRSYDLIWCLVGFNPAIQRREHIIRGIGGIWPIDTLTKSISAWATAAVSHAGDHEQAIEVLDFLMTAEFACD